MPTEIARTEEGKVLNTKEMLDEAMGLLTQAIDAFDAIVVHRKPTDIEECCDEFMGDLQDAFVNLLDARNIVLQWDAEDDESKEV